MNISVIIPVYNADQFVGEAVESALSQEETAEVVLIEDGSIDNSLAVCQVLAEQNENVRLLQHPNGGNRGAGASRNLGIKNASYDFIAFLDADDYYLPGRFTETSEVFATNKDADGVYEAIEGRFESDVAKNRWFSSNATKSMLTTMTGRFSPDQLYENLITWKYGYFSLIGLTVRRKIFDKTGYFNEKLRLHQDTDMCWRMAAVANLYPGKLEEPVTIRRIHQNNRTSAPRSKEEIYKSGKMLLRENLRWNIKNIGLKRSQAIFKQYILHEWGHFWALPIPKFAMVIKHKLFN